MGIGNRHRVVRDWQKWGRLYWKLRYGERASVLEEEKEWEEEEKEELEKVVKVEEEEEKEEEEKEEEEKDEKR
jgi:hypothetical protein